MKIAFFYSPIFLEHKSIEPHPENPKRLEVIVNAIKKDPFLSTIPFLEPPAAEKSIISLNHSDELIEKIENLEGYGYLDPDTYYSPASYKSARLAAGAGIDAVNAIESGKIEKAFCLVRPPGHHAERNRSMGFCLFNNAAITARYALTKGFTKIAIVDFDAHHGNGTQNSFYSDDKVLYISLHHYPFYPGTGNISETGQNKGKGLNINIPLPAGSGDNLYIQSFNKVVIPCLKQYKPDLLIISAGFDAHESDPLGGLSLSSIGYQLIAAKLKEACNKIILFLEGGYDLNALSDASLKTFRVLADKEERIDEIGFQSIEKRDNELINEVIEVQKDFWELSNE